MRLGLETVSVAFTTLVDAAGPLYAEVAADAVTRLSVTASAYVRQAPSCGCLAVPSLENPLAMTSLTRELWMNVPTRRAIVSIHGDVERLVAESGVQEGLVLVNAMHITASVFINDNEPGLHRDYDKWLEELAPFDPSPQRYHHNRTGEDNADAHHKRQIMGREVVVAITEGKLHLGPWEHIFYYEFDGQRRKRVLVKVIGE
jgi:secondary thiamine-phosphate synthase enzyme